MYTDHTAQLIAKQEVQELKVASYYVIKPGKIVLQNKSPGIK